MICTLFADLYNNDEESKDLKMTYYTPLILSTIDICRNNLPEDKNKMIDKIIEYIDKYENLEYRLDLIKWKDDKCPYDLPIIDEVIRTSVVGWLFDKEDEVKKYTKLLCELTNKNEKVLEACEVVSMCIYYARCNKTKSFIKDYVLNYYLLDFDDYLYKEDNSFNFQPIDTIVPLSIQLFLENDNLKECLDLLDDYDERIGKTKYIMLAIAEAYYKYIPTKILQYLYENANSDIIKEINEFLYIRKPNIQQNHNINDETLIVGLKKQSINGVILYFEYSNDLHELIKTIMNEYVSPHLTNLSIEDYEKYFPIESIENIKNNIFKHIDFLSEYYKDNKMINNYLYGVKVCNYVSFSIKTKKDFRNLIDKINIILFGNSIDMIIFFENNSEIIEYLKENSITFNDDIKKIIDETFYLKK